jgi:hypothetical protein
MLIELHRLPVAVSGLDFSRNFNERLNSARKIHQRKSRRKTYLARGSVSFFRRRKLGDHKPPFAQPPTLSGKSATITRIPN